MKVILKQDVKNLGEQDSIVNVSDGYARNFLFPRKLAIPANESALKIHSTEKKDKQDKLNRAKRLAQEKADKIAQKTFIIKAKSGEEGKLYGSVTRQDVCDAVQAQEKMSIDKKKLKMDDNIKYLGKYSAQYKLHKEVTAVINFEVIEE